MYVFSYTAYGVIQLTYQELMIESDYNHFITKENIYAQIKAIAICIGHFEGFLKEILAYYKCQYGL